MSRAVSETITQAISTATTLRGRDLLPINPPTLVSVCSTALIMVFVHSLVFFASIAVVMAFALFVELLNDGHLQSRMTQVPMWLMQPHLAELDPMMCSTSTMTKTWCYWSP